MFWLILSPLITILALRCKDFRSYHSCLYKQKPKKLKTIDSILLELSNNSGHRANPRIQIWRDRQTQVATSMITSVRQKLLEP